MTLRDRLRRAEPWLWTGAFAVLLLPLVLGAARAALPGINTDALVPWRLTNDVLGHGTNVAWAVGGPLFVFPDFPLLVVSCTIASELGPAYTVHAGLHFAFLALCVTLLVRACAAVRDGLDAAVGLAVAASYLSLALACGQPDVVHLVFYPAAHEGTVAGGLLHVALLAHVLRGGAGRAPLALLAAVAGLATLSDALVLSQFVVPGLVAAAFPAPGRCDPRAADRVFTWTAAGVGLGVAAYVALDATGFWQITMRASAPATVGMQESVRKFLRDAPSLFAWPDAVAAAVCCVFLVLAARWARRSAPPAAAKVVLWALVIAWVLTVCIPPLAGRWEDRATFRYMLPLRIVPLVAAAVAVVATSPGRGPRRAFLGVCLAACGLVAVTRGTLDLPATPYPGLVREIDAAASAHGVTEGLGGYWFASPATALSRHGLRVSPIRPGGECEPWLSNLDWTFDGAPDAPRWPMHRLIVVADLDRDAIRARFGEPTVVVTLAGRFDDDGLPIEVWMRPPPGPPFTSDLLRDDVLGTTFAWGLRSIDPRLAR